MQEEGDCRERVLVNFDSSFHEEQHTKSSVLQVVSVMISVYFPNKKHYPDSSRLLLGWGMATEAGPKGVGPRVGLPRGVGYKGGGAG